MLSRIHRMAGGLVVSLGLVGCGVAGTAYGAVSQRGPAQVEPIRGTSLKRVTLTGDAARRLGVETAPAGPAKGPGSTPSQTTVPLAAIIYDKDGTTGVYTTATGSLSYEREPVSIARVDGDTAVLKSGPAVGTQVVTVGAAELLGAELGVAGE